MKMGRLQIAIFLAFFVLLLVSSVSCNDKKVTCNMYMPNLYFSQIDTNDMAQVVFKKYKNDHTFNNLIETITIPRNTFKIEPVVSNDYSLFYWYGFTSMPPFSSFSANDGYNYDWIIEIPQAGTHDTISEIIPLFHETTEKEGASSCYSQLRSFKHNGQTVTFAEYDSGNFKINIHP